MAVGRLREKRIVANVTPYAYRYIRLMPSIVDFPFEIDRTLAAIREVT